jgi:16S rRNA (adenine1518-N6/adenine1519-N6)-dimethyltransferase
MVSDRSTRRAAAAAPPADPPSQPSLPSQPSQPSLRRMREFGVRPKRELGQNFLIDSNMLGVIERAAELEPGDVVLEIGGGLGVLSEHLAPLVAHVHVVELDRGLEPPLRDAIDPFDNVTLHVADAMRLDLRALEPAPTKVVANLPYGIAAGAILRTIEDLDGVQRWVGMVQKEVGERFAAGPGSGAYGVPSVLAQLACEVQVLRAVSRSVFAPVPNVDSVLVGLRRTGPAAPKELRELVAAAFAHRRKALAGSLALAPNAPADVRERTRAALAELGHRADVRAERLSPQDFRLLHAKLSA